MPCSGERLRRVVSRAPCPAVSRRALALAAGLCACGTAALCACGTTERGPEQRQAVPEAYEGPNFYEPPADPPLEPTPNGASGATGVPGFIGFVGEEGALMTCSAATERASAPDIGADPGLICAPIMRATISDFTFAGGDTANVYFGAESDLRGGTFFYPSGPNALTSDVTGGDWHIQGRVDGVSGFGLYSSGCTQMDAAAYGGIEFSAWGSIADGGGLFFFVGTAANQISHAWLNNNKPSADTPDEPTNLGRCVPVANRYDGTCSEPRTEISLTPSPTTLQVSWRDLIAGCPEATVNSREVISIAWYFPQSPAGAYDVDIHIDNLRFTDATPL
jgi:hypothetical protein